MKQKGRKLGTAKITKTLSIGLTDELFDRIESYCDEHEIKSYSIFFRTAAERLLRVTDIIYKIKSEE